MRTENVEPFLKALEKGQEEQNIQYLQANLPRLEQLIAELQERQTELAGLQYRARTIRDRLIGNRRQG
jgi:hypothetical protein